MENEDTPKPRTRTPRMKQFDPPHPDIKRIVEVMPTEKNILKEQNANPQLPFEDVVLRAAGHGEGARFNPDVVRNALVLAYILGVANA